MGGIVSASPAISCGESIVLDTEEPKSLAQRIFDRVSAKPDGIIRSYRPQGNHRTQTYEALWKRSGDIVAALDSAGAGPSSMVVVLTEDILDFLPAFWACLRGGFIAVPLMNAARDAIYRNDHVFDDALSLLTSPFLLIDDVFAVLVKQRAKAISATVVHLSSIGPATTGADRASLQDLACLAPTSGSTGTLKLAALSHSTLIYRNYARTPLFGNNVSQALGTFPLDTITGQHAVYLHSDSLTQLPATSIAVRPTIILDAIEEFEISVLSLTSSMIARLLEEDSRVNRSRRLESITTVGIGAEPISVRLVQSFAELLRRNGARPSVIMAGYGTTETGALVTGSYDILSADPLEAVCLGRPRAGVQMRIVGDHQTIVGSGEIGELEVSCPKKMFSGYWGDPELTRTAFTSDAWWKTGDLGKLVDGQLYLHGRVKETFIHNGKKFSLADIDSEIQNNLDPCDLAYSFVATIADEAEQLAVLYATGDRSREQAAAAAIQTALVRRFGLHSQLIVPTIASRFPKTAAGKVRRNKLNDLLVAERATNSGNFVLNKSTSESATIRQRLETIWKDALGLDSPLAPHENFFDLGGDSLRSLTLHLQIKDAFGVNISSEEFFADPTFENLLQLVRRKATPGKAAESSPSGQWPLPDRLRNPLLAALETWPGGRPTISRTMLAITAKGTAPPLFWVFNARQEPMQLAAALGRNQPLFAFRSGVGVSDYHEDDIQALALRYLSDISDVHPDGPLFIGGNCQGGIIALAIAEHALRRKRHVPLLVLMDWSFELQPYSGRVLLISGRDNLHHNAMRRFARPELAWSRAFANFEFAEIPGGYAQGFDRSPVKVLADVLTSRMNSALQAPTTLMPADAYRTTISAQSVPASMKTGERKTIVVTIGNDSDLSWRSTPGSGVLLGARWLDARGRIFPTAMAMADLPQIAPRSSTVVELTIEAPRRSGEFTLNLELSEEGNRWFKEPGRGCCRPVVVGSPRPRLPKHLLIKLARAIRRLR